MLKVSFAPDAKEADIRLLMIQVQGELAGGPGQLGDYYLRGRPAAKRRRSPRCRPPRSSRPPRWRPACRLGSSRHDPATHPPCAAALRIGRRGAALVPP